MPSTGYANPGSTRVGQFFPDQGLTPDDIRRRDYARTKASPPAYDPGTTSRPMWSEVTNQWSSVPLVQGYNPGAPGYREGYEGSGGGGSSGGGGTWRRSSKPIDLFAFNNILASLRSSGPGQDTSLPQVSRGRGASAEQEATARRAAFGRAKQQSGVMAASALSGLYGELQRRGMGGGGYEAGKIGETVAAASNPIQEVIRDQAMRDAMQAGRVADTEYEGAIRQRGQNIGVQQQQQARELEMMRMALQALSY